MSEIIVGTVAQLLIGAARGATVLGTDQSWIKFLASTGAVLLTFLPGAELDPQVMRRECAICCTATPQPRLPSIPPPRGAPKRRIDPPALQGAYAGSR